MGGGVEGGGGGGGEGGEVMQCARRYSVLSRKHPAGSVPQDRDRRRGIHLGDVAHGHFAGLRQDQFQPCGREVEAEPKGQNPKPPYILNP